MEQATINSIGLALFGAALTFASAWFWYTRQSNVKKAEALAATAEKRAEVMIALHEEAIKRIAELETKIRVQEVATVPIITAFQALLVKQLTHAAKPEMDALMVKVGPPDTLTTEERARLFHLLRERVNDYDKEISASERDAAVILPFVMLMAADEQARFDQVNKAEDLKLVTIVSVVGKDATEPTAATQPEVK